MKAKKKTTAKKATSKKTTKKASKKVTPVKPSKKDVAKKIMAAKTVEVKAAPAPLFKTASGLSEGSMAPDFVLTDSFGKSHKLSDYRGRRVVLYFYPKDNTPGCTIEACDFRDKNGAIFQAGGVTFGISPDHAESHKKFITKYNLGFTLLCDEEKTVAKRFGVWKEKHNYGQTYWGIERTTFVLNDEGKIVKIFPKVQVEGHVEKVLEYLRALKAASKTSSEPATPKA